MNRVLLTGRLTRDPEMRMVTNGKNVTQFSIATNGYRGGQEKAEFHTVVTWDRLAQICSQYLGNLLLSIAPQLVSVPFPGVPGRGRVGRPRDAAVGLPIPRASGPSICAPAGRSTSDMSV